MITKNKLAGGYTKKLSKDFDSSFIGRDSLIKSKKSKRTKMLMILLPIILILVAAMVAVVLWVIFRNNPTEKPADEISPIEDVIETTPEEEASLTDEEASVRPITNIASSNPTIQYGRLMLINPNFTVESDFIEARKNELISLNTTYGILEFHDYNGDNLLDKEAAKHLNEMLSDYTIANPGHSIQTVSCFRSVGTSCGRLCMPTGASDHHTGLTCDLIDPAYGSSLDTSTYDQHIEWQWLRANSYRYGFIDRFPEAWAGGSMDEPMNVDANGSTGLYETWHYRYVGLYAAKEIATGVYNNGVYDSLEHYLLARNLVTDLINGN